MRVIDIENIVTNMKDDARFVLRCEEAFTTRSAPPRRAF